VVERAGSIHWEDECVSSLRELSGEDADKMERRLIKKKADQYYYKIRNLTVCLVCLLLKCLYRN
jgi:hypothetical protein